MGRQECFMMAVMMIGKYWYLTVGQAGMFHDGCHDDWIVLVP
jgi:hypothetical protein